MQDPVKTTVPDRYVQALDRADPLQVLRKTPKRLRKLLRDAKTKELAWKADSATWSVHEVVGHLADHEFVFGARLRFVGAEDRPLLPAYDEKRFLARLGIDRASLEDLFDAWVAARAANVALLDRLPEDAWSRLGVHAERGEMSLLQIVVGTAGHDRIHEEQVERTIARARAARREEKQRAKAAAKSAKAKKPAKESKSRAGRAEDAGSSADEARKGRAKDGAKSAKPAKVAAG